MKEVIAKNIKGDRIIWAVLIILSIFSVLAVYSSTGSLAFKFKNGNVAFYVFKHASILGMGLIIVFVTHLIPYKYYSWLSQPFMIFSIFLLILTFFLGHETNDAVRFLPLPGGLTIQTSDFAKLALVMYVARQLSLKQEEIKHFSSAFLPVIIPVGIICMLILPSNFSTAAILFFTCIVLMFVGRISFKHIFILLISGFLILGSFVYLGKSTDIFRSNTWWARWESFTNGDMNKNHQVVQAKVAIATGGVLGKRPGQSTQRYFLPQAYSDFIYAIIIEEYGLIGGIVVLFLYLYLLYRSGAIVRQCNRTFPAFLATGLTLLIVIQALINMAVAVNLVPVTGQTLPLISRGGSSLLFTCTALGIILSISRTNNLRMESEINE